MAQLRQVRKNGITNPSLLFRIEIADYARCVHLLQQKRDASNFSIKDWKQILSYAPIQAN